MSKAEQRVHVPRRDSASVFNFEGLNEKLEGVSRVCAREFEGDTPSLRGVWQTYEHSPDTGIIIHH